MSQLASIDELTQAGNKRSYQQKVERLDQSIRSGNANFGLLMIDLNNLKKMNGTYGHDKGDISISGLCHLVSQIFKDSKVFRIGGDEFVVILEGDDYDKRDERIASFKLSDLGKSVSRSE